MSLLTRSTPVSREGELPAPPLHSPFVLGLLSGAQAATASLLCVLLPVVGAWMVSPRTTASWSEALRLGADGWLLAHHTGIAVPAGHVGLVPLGLTLVPALWCWGAGRRMGEALRTVTPEGLRHAGLRAICSFVGCYAVLLAVVSLIAASPVARPVSGQALLGGAVLATVTAGPALLRSLLSASRRSAAAVVADGLRLPATVRRAVPAAVVALGTWLAAGALAVAVALVLGRDRVIALHEALDPGNLGGAALNLSQMAFVPVVVLWAAAWVAGPGFAVGAGSSITPGATALGPLPAFPLLGGLPEPGTHHVAVGAVIALPVIAGALAGWWLRRAAGDSARGRDVVDALVVAALAGAGAGLLVSLASGPAGPGRMAEMGASAPLVALAVAGEVAAGCVAAVLLLPRRGTATGRPDVGAGRQLDGFGSWVRSLIRSSKSR